MRKSTMLAGLLVMVATGAIGAAALPSLEEPLAAQRAPGAAQREPGRNADEPPAARRLELLGTGEVHIGVSVRDLEGDQAGALTGARVEDVRSEGPAAAAGFEAGDIIVEFDGEKVRSARHLSRLVAETAPGRTVQAVVVRNGARHDLTVTPEAGRMAWSDGLFPGHAMRMHVPGLRLHERPFRFDAPGEGEEGRRGFELFVEPAARGRLGIGTQELTPELAEYFGTKGGVLVTRVEPDSPAARAGLRAGDVITAVNETDVRNVAELRRELASVEEGADLSIGYTRDRKPATATATLEKRERARRPATSA